MKKILENLFKKSIEVGDVKYSDEEVRSNWIGNRPATLKIIETAEKKLNVSLPEDYKELLLVANGFKTSSHAVEPNFLPVEKIDYLKNLDPFIVEGYEDTLFDELERSIVIGGEAETQFLLIPPKQQESKWKYWKFAHWIPGEMEYENLTAYLNNVINFLDKK